MFALPPSPPPPPIIPRVQTERERERERGGGGRERERRKDIPFPPEKREEEYRKLNRALQKRKHQSYIYLFRQGKGYTVPNATIKEIVFLCVATL